MVKRSVKSSRDDGSAEVKSRDISQSVRWMLWGKAAGRCQFDGCNQLLWKSPQTQQQINLAEAAHIWAFKPNGARGNSGINADLLNSLNNLMLVCDSCHKTIDSDKQGIKYSVGLLQGWKRKHEQRVEIATGIAPGKHSHVLLYGANIGQHSTPLSHLHAAEAMFPRRYPAHHEPISLGLKNSAAQERDDGYWKSEFAQLRRRFDDRVRNGLSDGVIEHLSVFGLAPQPLLILLGSMLIDIPRVDVYQLHREPEQTWVWPEAAEPLEFRVLRPSDTNGIPALVIALTANVDVSRVESVLDQRASVWQLTIPSPNNDHIKSRTDLSNFRRTVRPLLDEIKNAHGQNTPLHVFPVGSVSAAVELGRVRMPKAHPPWVVYDQLQGQGFVRALTFSSAGVESNVN
ncbi:SAVED domain-containing protein [bacterium]|nr:SAVED domain-containing protein [bacterium]